LDAAEATKDVPALDVAPLIPAIETAWWSDDSTGSSVVITIPCQSLRSFGRMRTNQGSRHSSIEGSEVAIVHRPWANSNCRISLPPVLMRSPQIEVSFDVDEWNLEYFGT
jgi:hypothetical protein